MCIIYLSQILAVLSENCPECSEELLGDIAKELNGYIILLCVFGNCIYSADNGVAKDYLGQAKRVSYIVL